MMEISEPSQTHFPLDFSVNIAVKLSGSITNMENTSTNNNSSSAFKVVTPKGKTDGKFEMTYQNSKGYLIAYVEPLLLDLCCTLCDK